MRTEARDALQAVLHGHGLAFKMERDEFWARTEKDKERGSLFVCMVYSATAACIPARCMHVFCVAVWWFYVSN